MAGKLRIGLIGTGSIARAHLMAMNLASQKVKLTAVCDINEDAVRKFAKEAGVDAVYTDAATMLKEADIGSVTISVSHDWHARLAIAAAEAGKHVLLEKPMATTMQNCRDIIRRHGEGRRDLHGGPAAAPRTQLRGDTAAD